MIPLIRSLTLASLVMAGTAACSTRVAEPVENHRTHTDSQAIDDRSSDTLRTGEAAEKLSGLQEISSKELKRLSEEINAGHADRALETLGQSLLRETFINDPQKYRTEYGRNLLTLFNRAALDVANKNPTHVARNQWMKRWSEVLSSTCDEQLKNCSRDLFEFVKSDSQSQDLLAIYAHSITDAKARYRILKIAFDVSSSTNPINLEREFIATAPIIIKDLKASGKSEDRQEAKRLELAIETILNKASPERRRELVDVMSSAFPIWSFSNSQSDQTTATLARLNFEAGAASRIYKGSTVDPEMMRVLNERLTKSGSVKEEFEKLRKTHGDLTKALGLAGSLSSDEYLYLIDSIYSNHLNADQAFLIWSGSHKDAQRLAEIGQLYVRIRVLALLSETNAKLRHFFNQKDVFSNETVLSEAIRQGDLLATSWTILFTQVKQLTIFLDKTGLEYSSQEKGAQAFIYDLAALPQNVKLFAVWPLMNVISYHLSKTNFSKTFQTWYGPITITTGTVLSQLIDGMYRPWLNFGNDGNGVTTAGVFYGIAYTLMTGILEDFGIDRVEFFREFANRYLASLNRKVKSIYDTFETSIVRNQHYSEFIEICHAGRLSRNRSMNLKALYSYAYLGIGQGSGASDRVAEMGRELLSGYAVINQTESITMRYEPRAARVKGILEIFKAAAKSEDEKKQLDAIYDDALYYRRLYMGQFYKQIRQARQCIFDIVGREYSTQTKVLLAESEYLRQVHRAIKGIRDATPDQRPQLIALENQRLQKVPSYLKGRVEAYGQISESGLNYNQLDGLIRAAAYMRDGLATDTVEIPPILPEPKLVLPPDYDRPQLGFVNKSYHFPFVDDENEFVRMAMRSWTGSNGGFVAWDGSNTRDAFWVSVRWNLLAMLYKVGEIEMYDVSAPRQANGRYPVITDRIRASELLDEVSSYAKALRFSDDDRRLLEILGSTGWVKDATLTGVYRDPTSAGRRGLLDMVAQKIVADINGTDEGTPPPDGVVDIIKVPVLAAAQQFYLDQNSIGRLQFPISKEAEAAIQNVYREPARKQLRAWQELIDEAEARTKSDLAKGISLEVDYKIGGTPLGLPDRYLGKAFQEDLEARMRLFHKNTGRFFKEP